MNRMKRSNVGVVVLHTAAILWVIPFVSGFVGRSSPAKLSDLSLKRRRHGRLLSVPHRDRSLALHSYNGIGTNEKATTEALQELEQSFQQLDSIRPGQPSADVSAPVTRISAGSSYTRLWTKYTWEQHSKPPHYRYCRHVLRWPASSTARTILPTVLVSTAWSIAVTLLTRLVPSLARVAQQSGSMSIVGYLAAPLSLILTVRANASLGRLTESRLYWGQLVLHSRSLANKVKVYLYPHAPLVAIQIIRHLACVGWTLKSVVRGEEADYQSQVFRTILAPNDLPRITRQPNKNVALTSRIRALMNQIVSSASVSGEPQTAVLLASQLVILEGQLASLEAAVGGCERLFGSPIPPTYSRHLSRIMVRFLLLLPLSLAGAGVSPLGTVLASLIASYVFVGIDEVGMEIENCFRWLPLQQLAAAVHNGTRDQFLGDDHLQD